MGRLARFIRFFTRSHRGDNPPPVPTQNTVTGVSPLTLVNAIAHRLVSLTQTGKVTQESTPTPSAPKDIVCNNGALKYGVLGKNLFDKNSEQSGNYYVNSNGNVAQAASNASVYFRCQPNTTYYFKHTSVVGGCRAFTVSVEDWTIGTPANEMVGAVTSEPNVVRSITTEADAKWVFFLYGRSTGTTATYEEQAADFMVSTEPLTADTPYEPFKGIGLYVDGTPEVLSIGGKNITSYVLDLTVEGDGTGGTVVNDLLIGGVPKENTQYTISVNIQSTDVTFSENGNLVYFRVFYSDGTSAYAGVTNQNYQQSKISVTTTAGKTFERLSLYKHARFTNGTIKVTNLMIEEGTTATDYEPYKGEPQTASAENLFAVGDYADTQEIISGAVTRKIGIYVFDGTETWIDGNYGYITEAVQDQSGETYTPLCTHFRGTTGTPQSNSNTFRCYRTSGDVGRVYFAPNRTTYPTKESFAALVKAQYDAGTPIIIVYPLKAETTEQVTAQPMATVEGTNVLSWTAAVQDKVMSAEYMYKEPKAKVGTAKVGSAKI